MEFNKLIIIVVLMKEITEHRNSPRLEKIPYESPQWEVFLLPKGLDILEIVSLEGEVEDYGDSDDF